MFRTVRPSIAVALLVGVSVALAACNDDTLAPEPQPDVAPQLSYGRGDNFSRSTARDLATMRRVTARYQDLNVAIADGFVFLHGCETRDEGPVGTVYVHMGRLTDGKIDPSSPDALVYEPAKKPNRKPKLVAVELAIPYALWTKPRPPRFHGNVFQAEDEFGVWGLHAWVWRKNPEGMFAEVNPRLTWAVEE
jgi:hypothetical protein